MGSEAFSPFDVNFVLFLWESFNFAVAISFDEIDISNAIHVFRLVER